MDPPNDFDFPFPPYKIQKDFMTALYNALENSKLGIFESPTGTGKSLSIVCGALRWLLDYENKKKESLERRLEELKKYRKQTESSNENWLEMQAITIKNSKEYEQIKLELEKMKKYYEKIENIKNCRTKKPKRYISETKKIHEDGEISLTQGEPVNITDEDNDLILEDIFVSNNLSDSSSDNDENKEDEYEPTKIIFCSRTHSQLSQFVGEILKSPYKNSIRVITLASRQTYCINEAVQKLKNLTLINERCLDLKQKRKDAVTKKCGGKIVKRQKTFASGNCPFMNLHNIEELKNEAIVNIHNVDRFINNGIELKACPYYGSRASVKNAQIVLLPYNSLLHKSTRTSSGIKIKNNVIIIDEAHNLLEAIEQLYSCVITGYSLTYAYSQLIQYKNKYEKKFSSNNLLRLNQIIYIIGKFVTFLGGKPGNHYFEKTKFSCEFKIFTLQDFVFKADIDSINIFQLLEFCNRSKLVNKLRGFIERYQPSVVIQKETTINSSGVNSFLEELSKSKTTQVPPDQEKTEFITSNPILSVIAFLECLTNVCGDGRILCLKENTIGKGYLKYLVLNPASHFVDIVKEARSVIVAGGTMQPISEFKEQLFIAAGGNKERIFEFSCDHIIPPENILPIVISSGPCGKVFEFSYEQRESHEVITELGRLLVNIINIIPGGVICFFPSYDYETQVFNHFKNSGVITKIERKKKFFREPKISLETNTVFNSYTSAIKNTSKNFNNTSFTNCTGALLFSVVGGKLSEGLNFSDDLGRCIIIIGMPYPNIKSPELKEKMSYLEENVNCNAGKIYYENLCLKAVNQCIGRAVRHKNDYASVLLIDQRFKHPNVQKALPAWIQRSLRVQNKFGGVIGELKKFFNSK